VKTARQLGLDHLFEDIFDIIAADFVAKPHPGVYARFFEKHDVEPKRAALFEDIARNLVVPHQHGMTTVLVAPRQGEIVEREAWEVADGSERHVDFVTEDLGAFLESLAAQLGANEAAALSAGSSKE